jgi:mono/diheme cytochrome c family protein
MNPNQRSLSASFRLLAIGLILAAVPIWSISVIAQQQTLPEENPDAEVGLEIFAERCAGCHGATGAGDGELAINLEAPPAAFADPEFRKTADPGIMFATIFNGSLAAGMPPFGPGTENSNPISEENMWDLVAAVYSLGTPVESIGMGEAIYEQDCVACHGIAGVGDGPDAAGLESPLPDLSDPGYWFSRSNEAVFTAIEGGAIPEHATELNELVRWSAVDYARTFAYSYAEPVAASEIFMSATVIGSVRNGTTDETVAGVTARLRAFTSTFQETLNLTTTVGVDGRYRFDLDLVPPDWIFLATVAYGDLSFSSDAAQVSSAETELELPITVYEETTNPAAVSIDQIHFILEFFDGGLAVSELYVFSNKEAAVFIGETGDAANGTVQVSLPQDARNVAFERTMGSIDSTIPAQEVIQTASGWADTLPLRPGQGGLNLIVRYELPYEDGVKLSHPINYDAANVTVILPDVGVEIEQGAWNFQGTQQMGASGTLLTYDRINVPSGSSLDLNLSGRPTAVAGPGGNTVVTRNQTSELIVGATVFVVAAAIAFLIVRRWQAPELAEETTGVEAGGDPVNNLLRAIAILDEAHERGEVADEQYESQRDQLKSELKTLWR